VVIYGLCGLCDGLCGLSVCVAACVAQGLCGLSSVWWPVWPSVWALVAQLFVWWSHATGMSVEAVQVSRTSPWEEDNCHACQGLPSLILPGGIIVS
jgi:hypothetical protein